MSPKANSLKLMDLSIKLPTHTPLKQKQSSLNSNNFSTQKCRCSIPAGRQMPQPDLSALKDDIGTLPQSDDFLPAVMQTLHYYTEMMQYEQLQNPAATTTRKPAYVASTTRPTTTTTRRTTPSTTTKRITTTAQRTTQRTTTTTTRKTTPRTTWKTTQRPLTTKTTQVYEFGLNIPRESRRMFD